jgi:hypothetical protein
MHSNGGDFLVVLIVPVIAGQPSANTPSGDKVSVHPFINKGEF